MDFFSRNIGADSKLCVAVLKRAFPAWSLVQSRNVHVWISCDLWPFDPTVNWHNEAFPLLWEEKPLWEFHRTGKEAASDLWGNWTQVCQCSVGGLLGGSWSWSCWETVIFFAQDVIQRPRESREGGSIIIDGVVCERAGMHYRDKQMHVG